MSPSWRDCLDLLEVSNVFIYVGDAVRLDFTPQNILSRGISFETISASIHSPTSFASLTTGQHPPKHGVYAFTNRLREDTETLLHHPSRETRFINSVRDKPSGEDPIFSVLNVEPPAESSPFEEITDSFAIMERGPGGHAPYGNFEGTAWQYFEASGKKSRSTIREEYSQSIARDAAIFADRLDELEENGLLNETLVIYTSDHGELLGESGLLGHNAPMCPELIEVPTVFVHPELPDLSVNDGVFRHIDLAPTVLDILEEDIGTVDGNSILQVWPCGLGVSFYRSHYPTGRLPGFSGSFTYEGVWEKKGGHVFSRTNLLERLVVLAGKAVWSPKRSFLRRNLLDAIPAFTAGDTTYGKPSITEKEARMLLTKIRKGGVESSESHLSESAEEQLHDLGYL